MKKDAVNRLKGVYKKNYGKYFKNTAHIKDWLKLYSKTVGWENWTQLKSGVIITFAVIDEREFAMRAETRELIGEWIYMGKGGKAIQRLSRIIACGLKVLNARIDSGDLIREPVCKIPKDFYRYTVGLEK